MYGLRHIQQIISRRLQQGASYLPSVARAPEPLFHHPALGLPTDADAESFFVEMRGYWEAARKTPRAS